MAVAQRTGRINSGDVSLFYRVFGSPGATPSFHPARSRRPLRRRPRRTSSERRSPRRESRSRDARLLRSEMSGASM